MPWVAERPDAYSATGSSSASWPLRRRHRFDRDGEGRAYGFGEACESGDGRVCAAVCIVGDVGWADTTSLAQFVGRECASA